MIFLTIWHLKNVENICVRVRHYCESLPWNWIRDTEVPCVFSKCLHSSCASKQKRCICLLLLEFCSLHFNSKCEKKSNFGYIQFKTKHFSTINTHTTEKNSGCLHYAVSIKHLIWVSKCLLTFVYDHTYTLSWGMTAQTALQFKASLVFWSKKLPVGILTIFGSGTKGC